jgi:hypothetical protein
MKLALETIGPWKGCILAFAEPPRHFYNANCCGSEAFLPDLWGQTLAVAAAMLCTWQGLRADEFRNHKGFRLNSRGFRAFSSEADTVRVKKICRNKNLQRVRLWRI